MKFAMNFLVLLVTSSSIYTSIAGASNCVSYDSYMERAKQANGEAKRLDERADRMTRSYSERGDANFGNQAVLEAANAIRIEASKATLEADRLQKAALRAKTICDRTERK